MTEPYNTPLPVASPPVYLLLIDSRVSNYQDIINAKKPGVHHIVFDAPSRPTHSTKLIKNIEDQIAAFGIPAITSIGLVQHNDRRPIYEMFGRLSDRKKPIIHEVATHDPDFQSWNSISIFITKLRTTYGIMNFDMMACALYSNLDWKCVIDRLTVLTGVTVRASTDDTGAAALGGDWFLESHTGVNLKSTYFTDAIESYNGLLYTAPVAEAGSTATPKKLLLIDHRIKDIDVIINSMNEHTYGLVFNSFYDTSTTILSKLRFLSGNNRYILDHFHYVPPTLPTRMDASGNHCTPCDDFDTNELMLDPGVLENEYLEYTMSDASGGNGGVWPFYRESTNITIEKPVFFQRAKIAETTESVPHGSTEPATETVVLNYKKRPMVFVSDLDAFYELGQNVGEISVGGGLPTFDCVGIIQHTVEPEIGYKFIGLGDESISPAIVQDVASRDSGLVSWASFTAFIQSLKTTHQMTTLDLMACALYANPDWKYVIDTLAVRENIKIRASLDNTGSESGSAGIDDDEANWVLETDNVSLTTVYFTDKIYEWKYVLATYIDTRFNALRWNDSMYATRAYDARLKIAAGTSNFTIETWYYETASRTNGTIVDMGNYNYTFQIRNLNISNPVGLSFYNSGTGWLYAESAVVPVAQWSHLAITRSGSTFTFYVNGIARQTFTSSASLYSNNSTFAIGWQSPDTCQCNRQKTDSVLYDIRLWNVARTATEILMNRNRIVPANSTGLVANYLCTDNGGTFNDRSANALHTTIQNYNSARWSNSTVTIPNIGFLINNGYSLRTSNTGTALNAFTHFDNITYTDFSGVDLSGVNFRGADLTGCNFTNANLTNTNFANAYLISATTTNAITTGSNIARAVTNLTSTVLNFDGVDDAVNIGIPAWTYSTQFRTTMTVECWFKTADTNNQKGSATLVARYNTGGFASHAQFLLGVGGTAAVTFALTNTSGTLFQVTSPSTYKDMLWHHAAATYNSVTGVSSVYVDGVLVNSGTNASYGLLSNNTTMRLTFGSDDAGLSPGNQTDRQFRGSISDVRIWNVVRSAAEIAANYQQRLTGNESGLLGYWKLNQGYGSGWGSYSKANDSTINRGWGTLTNMGATPSGSWIVSNLNFQPRISTLTLGPNNGTYNADVSFSMIDPSSNSLGDFTYAVSPTSIATVANGAATTKTIYATSGAISIPTLSVYDFPEIASLSSWQIDISFTVTGGAGTWRALVGDMYNNVNTFRGWGLWVSANNPSRIHWSWMGTTAEPASITVNINTPYVLTAAQSSGTITLTLRNVANTFNSSLSISNLVALYNFDSTATDSSVNNNHLTNVSSVSYNTSDYKRGTAAARFNLSNYFQVSNDGRFSPDNFTLSFWVKPVNSNGVHQAIASCRNVSAGVFTGWFIYIGPSNNLEFITGTGTTTSGGSVYTNFGGTITHWVHVVITMTKSTGAYALYIDGNLYNAGTRTYANNTVTNLRIGAGANEGSAQFFMGNGSLLDEFRIYSKVLTASEIGSIVADSSYSGSFSVGANVIGKGPVTIGGWQNYSVENFPGTISYVNVSVPTNQRVVSFLSSTDGTPATVTATQASLLDYSSGAQTASLTVNKATPTFSTSFANMTKTNNHSFAFDSPVSNSIGAFSFTSSNTSVATINPAITINALKFNGTTNYVDFGANIVELGKSSFTIECWVKTTGTSMGLLNCQNSDTTWVSGEKSLYIDGNGIPAFVGFGCNWIYSTVAVNDNAWHHIAVTWAYTSGSSGTAAIYIDGINRTSTNYSVYAQYAANTFNLGTFVFGKPSYSESVNFFNGAVCELRIWNVARSATEINQNYRRMLVGNESGLVAYNRFNQGVASGTNTDVIRVENNDLSGGYTGIMFGGFTLSGSSSNWVSGVSIRPVYDVNVVGAGTTTITATQEATPIYAALSTTATLTVTKTAPTIGAFTLPSKTFGDASFNLTAPTSNVTTTSVITQTATVMVPPSDINALIMGSAWTKLGGDIDGEAAGDESGYNVAMSADGTIVAIGARNNDGSGNLLADSGHVRVYKYTPSKTVAVTDQNDLSFGPIGWTRMGADIDGEGNIEYSGFDIAISADGMTVAIGAHGNDGTSTSVNNNHDKGSVRVYRYNVNKTSAQMNQSLANFGPRGWNRLGDDIDGEAIADYLGRAVSLSADGTVVAIGATHNDGTASAAGHVRVFKYTPGKGLITNDADISFGPVGWTRLGKDIDGEAGTDESGYSVALSADGTIVAIGARYNDGSGNLLADSGHVRVYKYTPSKTVAVTNQNDLSFGPIGWTRLGADIDGEGNIEYSGWSVALSADGTTVAIGAVGNDANSLSADNGQDRGNVRVYRYNANKTTAQMNQSLANFGPRGWNRLGEDIDGEAFIDYLGISVSLSADGNIVACGAGSNESDLLNVLPDAFYLRTGGSNWRSFIPLLMADSTTNRLAWGPDEQFYTSITAANEIAKQFSYFAGYWLNAKRATNGQSFSVPAFAGQGSVGTFIFTATSNYPNTTYTGRLTGYNATTYTLIPQTDGISAGQNSNFGHVRVFRYNPNKLVAQTNQALSGFGPAGWDRIGNDIDGEYAGDESGTSVRISSDGTKLIVGAHKNDGPMTSTVTSADNRGHVRVYSIPTTNELSYTSSNSAVADICGTILMIKGVNGQSIITASQTSNTVTGVLDVSGGTYTLRYNPLTYTSSNPSVATVSTYDGTVNILSSGSTVITARQGETRSYTSRDVSGTLIISGITPTIGALSLPAKNFGDASFNLTAPTSDSSGAFSYSSSNTAVATVTSGGTVTVVGAGSTTITATQAATTNYTSGSVTASLVVSPIAPTIGALTAPAKNFGDASFNLTSPTSDSSGAFSYSSSNTAVATVTSGGTVTVVGAGSTTITATQAATTNYTSGSVSASLVVSPIAPTIGTFTIPQKQYTDVSFTLTPPSSNSNGQFTYSTDASGSTIATVTSGGIVTLTGVVGNAVITATQDACGNYTGGSSVSATLLVIAELSNFTVPSNKVYGDTSFDLTDPTTIYTGEPFTFMSSDTTVASIGGAGGRTVTILKAGSTTITAKQAATGAHGELSITAVLVVAKKTTVITLSAITKNYGDASFNLSPSSNNTDAGAGVFTITSRNTDVISIFDASYASIRGVGSVLIDITQSETTNFTSASATVMITVNKGTPVLSAFTVSTTRTYSSTPFSAVAYPTSTSNGAITYSSSDSTVATIDSSGIITLLKAGYVNFIATQASTVYYNSNTKISNTMTVTRQALALTRSSPTESTINKTFGDSYFNVVATNNSNGGTITYETSNSSVAGIVGSATAGVISVVSAGTATITARREQTDQYTSDPISWTVEVARTTTTLSGLSDLSYNVTTAPFTVTASSASNGAVTYALQDPTSGVLTIHPTSGLVRLRSAGSAVIVASQAQGSNHLAPASITATITVSSAGNALQGATITSTSSFAAVNLEGASLAGVSITNTAFTAAKLTNANLTNAVIVSANFASADLSGATLAGATITGATFTAASLKNADLSGAVLTNTAFTGSDLSGARLTGVDASGASFANAKLTNVDMTGANIANVNFTNTSIKGAIIADVSFSPLQKIQLLKNSDNRDIGQIIIPEVTGTTVLAAISESSPLRSIENLDLTTATVAVVVPTTSTSATDILPDVVLNVATSDKFYLPINESEFFQIEGVKYFATGGVVRNYLTNAVVEVISYNGTPVWLIAGSIVGLVLQTNTLNSSSFVVPSRMFITDIAPFMPTTLPTGNNTTTPIVYSSNNLNIATIDASSGQITITGNFVGYVTFTATQVQNATYEPGVSVSNSLFVDRAINFSLSGLNQTFNLSTLAILDASSISLEATDATAVFYVRLSDINNLFMYQSDASEITNVSADDIKYYVFHRKWPTELKLNPSHAMMNKTESLGMLGIGEELPENRSLAKHDFIRYIAYQLFNTIHGVDLFQNETELQENSVFLGETVRNNIETIISGISTTSASQNMAYDASGNKYLTNDASGNTNLCRELMRHIAALAPSRFYGNIPNHAGLKNVPFMENDTIQYKLVIQAAAIQNLLTGVSVIPSRSYTIKLVIKNTVNNITNTNTMITDSIMYPNSYPYSSSVRTYAPTVDSSGVYNIYSPPAPIPFARFGYNGWYYTNSTAWVNVAPAVRNHIKWLVGANTATSKVSDLQYIRMNLKIHNTASLPFLMVYTQAGSSKKYPVMSGNGSLVNGTVYSFYMNFNSYNREPATVGATNAALAYTIGTGSFADSELIASIAVETDSNATAGHVEFTLSSVVVGELSGEKEYGFEAAVPETYP